MRRVIAVTDPSQGFDSDCLHLIAGMPGVSGEAQLTHWCARHSGPVGDGEGAEWGALTSSATPRAPFACGSQWTSMPKTGP